MELLVDSLHAIIELLNDLVACSTQRRSCRSSDAAFLVAIRFAIGAIEVASSRHCIATAVAKEAFQMVALASRWNCGRRDIVGASLTWVYWLVL
jgi:hypothetical protein